MLQDQTDDFFPIDKKSDGQEDTRQQVDNLASFLPDKQYSPEALWCALCGISLYLQAQGKGKVKFYCNDQDGNESELGCGYKETEKFKGRCADMFEYESTNGHKQKIQVFFPVNNKFLVDGDGTQCYKPTCPKDKVSGNLIRIWPMAESIKRNHWVFLVQHEKENVVFDSKSGFNPFILRIRAEENGIRKVLGDNNIIFHHVGAQGLFDTVNCGRYLALAVFEILKNGYDADANNPNLFFVNNISEREVAFLHDMSRITLNIKIDINSIELNKNLIPFKKANSTKFIMIGLLTGAVLCGVLFGGLFGLGFVAGLLAAAKIAGVAFFSYTLLLIGGNSVRQYFGSPKGGGFTRVIDRDGSNVTPTLSEDFSRADVGQLAATRREGSGMGSNSENKSDQDSTFDETGKSASDEVEKPAIGAR
jgi:hypothetical protein